MNEKVDDKLLEEINGRFYAHALMINVLLTDYLNRLPDKGKDTEHLEALVEDMQKAFEAQSQNMSPVAHGAAEHTIMNLLGASLSPYWRK